MSYEVTVTGNNAVSVDISGVSTISVDVSQVGQQGVKGVNYITGGWVVSTAYAINDVLVNNGTSYICILAHTSASTDEPGVGVNTATYWEVFSASGADGADGTGFTGGSYSAGTGVVTFTSDDGLGFVTGDLRGADGTGTVNSVDITGGTGITSTGGPITSTGAITVALDAATQTSLGLADTSLQPSDIGALPTIRPSLNLDFANTNYLDSRITFSRSTTATYYDQFGTLQTAAIGEARFDHDPATGEAKGLLIEEQRTNLLTYSEQFDNANWLKTRTTVTANDIAAPDGAITADKVIADVTEGAHLIRSEFSAVSGTTYTFSVCVKAAGEDFVAIRGDSIAGILGDVVYFSLADGSVTQSASGVTASSQDLGDGWFRLSVTATATASANARATIQSSNAGTGPAFGVSYSGDGTSGIYVWGAQLEVGSFPTSYIKTEAATATRVIDAVTLGSLSDIITTASGTAIVDLEMGGLQSSGTTFILRILQSGLGDTNSIGIREGSVISGTDLFVRSGATTTVDSGSLTVTQNTPQKLAISWEGSNWSFATSNGSTTASGAAPLSLDELAFSSGNAPRTYSKLALYPRRLTNAELVALTEV